MDAVLRLRLAYYNITYRAAIFILLKIVKIPSTWIVYTLTLYTVPNFRMATYFNKSKLEIPINLYE